MTKLEQRNTDRRRSDRCKNLKRPRRDTDLTDGLVSLRAWLQPCRKSIPQVARLQPLRYAFHWSALSILHGDRIPVSLRCAC
jgi:hypothetical protein